ncbi:hypothetical protein M422DRAFT_268487 [Sphaerobolus stellatus SS14]|uniref:Uncharacterized protein n=1 Tax=Sphaerobolus stellatus (strain SS14) TaxID=990650 RepID=A0A0C9UXD5_SPHS4|nr:hypothetical protein M422DRAFT_268487 [Sphaerobolus stellatus SS14]
MIRGHPMVVSIQDSKASHSRNWEREQGLDMKNAEWISKAEAMGVRFTTEAISTIKV